MVQNLYHIATFKLSLQYIKYQESMYRSPTMSLHAIAFWENVKSPSNSYVESYLLPTENTKKKKKKKGKKGRKKKLRKKKKENKQKVVFPSKAGSMKKVGHLVAGVERVTFS